MANAQTVAASIQSVYARTGKFKFDLDFPYSRELTEEELAHDEVIRTDAEAVRQELLDKHQLYLVHMENQEFTVMSATDPEPAL